jgi:hypothetical protein
MTTRNDYLETKSIKTNSIDKMIIWTTNVLTRYQPHRITNKYESKSLDEMEIDEITWEERTRQAWEHLRNGVSSSFSGEMPPDEAKEEENVSMAPSTSQSNVSSQQVETQKLNQILLRPGVQQLSEPKLLSPQLVVPQQQHLSSMSKKHASLASAPAPTPTMHRVVSRTLQQQHSWGPLQSIPSNNPTAQQLSKVQQVSIQFNQQQTRVGGIRGRGQRTLHQDYSRPLMPPGILKTPSISRFQTNV